MRHLNKGRNLSRSTSHRKALLRNMATSLFEHGKMETTEAKAKELRGVADRLVTLAKQNTLHAKRLAAGFIRTRDVLVKLFDEIAPGFSERHGGYTRIIKTRTRHGDAAPMAIIELMPSGAPAGKSERRPAAPAVKKTAVTPTTKERFEK